MPSSDLYISSFYSLSNPSVLLQDPNQKEDELSAVHVKQGFSTTYANLLNNDEYGSSLSKAANLNPAKIWNNFKDILAKKEDLNTFQVSQSPFCASSVLNILLRSNSCICQAF